MPKRTRSKSAPSECPDKKRLKTASPLQRIDLNTQHNDVSNISNVNNPNQNMNQNNPEHTFYKLSSQINLALDRILIKYH